MGGLRTARGHILNKSGSRGQGFFFLLSDATRGEVLLYIDNNPQYQDKYSVYTCNLNVLLLRLELYANVKDLCIG